MIYIDNKSTNPSFNHALEEYYLRDTRESVFMLWQNEPTVLIGRHQNLELEVDLDFAIKHNIKVVRRLSGGGTVYGDKLNMQYSFISDYRTRDGELFKKFAEPVVLALNKLGLNARFTGRNDIMIDDKKVSGNAQYRCKNRIIHHGTLLFDCDMDLLKGAIKVRDVKFSDKCVRSVVGRIGLIKDYTDMSVHEFMDYIKKNIIEFHKIQEAREPHTYELDGAETYLEHFKDLRFEQEQESFDKHYVVKHPFGLVEYGLDFDNYKRVKRFKISGDFFSEKDLDEYLATFKGIKIDEFDKAWDIGEYIIGMDREIFLNDIKRMVDK